MTRRRRGGIKRGESKLASNHFSCALHSLDPSEIFMELHREERGRRQRQPGGEKGESKGGESGQASNLALR